MAGATAAVLIARTVPQAQRFARLPEGIAWLFTTIFLVTLAELPLGVDQSRQPEAGRVLVDAALL